MAAKPNPNSPSLYQDVERQHLGATKQEDAHRSCARSPQIDIPSVQHEPGKAIGEDRRLGKWPADPQDITEQNLAVRLFVSDVGVEEARKERHAVIESRHLPYRDSARE